VTALVSAAPLPAAVSRVLETRLRRKAGF